jgi:hypothetical protein
MCKHIAKALQARSKAVKNAIERYNNAAAALDPPMHSVSWEQVVEYAFLADFDILRDTRAEVQSKPWSRPAYRLAMDRYFKTLRAREEIKRLNIEIRRVITWIRDENCFLRRMERSMRVIEGKTEEQIEVDALMAVQVRLYREQRGRFDAGHLENFWKLAQTPGFTGSLRCGVPVEHREVEQRLRDLCTQLGDDTGADEMEVDEEGPEMGRPETPRPVGESDDEDEGHEAREEMVSGLLYQISMLALDNGVRGDVDDE